MEMQRGKKHIPTSGRAALFKKMVLEVAFISNSLLNANTEKKNLCFFIVYHITFILILVMEVNSKTNLLNHIPANIVIECVINGSIITEMVKYAETSFCQAQAQVFLRLSQAL